MNWFRALVVLVLAALCEFALPAVFLLAVAVVVVWAVQGWWRRRQALEASRAVVLEAMWDAYNRAVEVQERRAFLDGCRTVRLHRVAPIPVQRRPPS